MTIVKYSEGNIEAVLDKTSEEIEIELNKKSSKEDEKNKNSEKEEEEEEEIPSWTKN